MEKESKIEILNKEINILRNKNKLIEEDLSNKEQKIIELNNELIIYKKKKESNEELIIFQNKINEYDTDKKIENYELELNKIKNNLNESEIQNSKLILENNILLNKIENINKEKNTEIKVIESLYQKQIDNYNKTITELNNKLVASLNEKKNNKNDIEKENKIKILNEENSKYKKDLEQIMLEKEELKKISLDKDKIIEKLEVEIEKYDFENNNKDKIKDDNMINEINNLRHENEELKKMFKSMTQGINKANELYNEKLIAFNKQILYKNNKLLEYKNKISVLKVKINELYEELNTLKGNSNANNNSFF